MDAQVECELVNVITGKKYKKFMTKRQMENLPFHICLPYEAKDRLEEHLKRVAGF